MSEGHHRLRIFLCHSSGDKQAVRYLYKRLRTDGFDPWLDEENLLPGQDWHQVIPQAVSEADVVLVCLSRGSINKKGYVQKEIKYALDAADEQPENTIYLIPLKLEECDIPQRLRRWQWVSLFDATGYDRLLNALRHRAESVSLSLSADTLQTESNNTALSEILDRQTLQQRPEIAQATNQDKQAQDQERGEPRAAARASEKGGGAYELKAGQGKTDLTPERATQAPPEEIQHEKSRRKRVNFLTWVGIVILLAGTAIVIISMDWVPAGSLPRQPSNANSASAETYLNDGKACREKKDYDCALNNYNKAIELNPQYIDAYYSRGIVYDDKGDYDQAIRDYTRAIELDPQYAEAYYNRGFAYDNKGDHDQAIKDYSKVIELKPQIIAAYINRGAAYAQKGDYDQAIRDYTKAIESNPQHAGAYYNRGSAHDDKGDYDQAIRDYTKAIELNPRYSDAYVNRGVVYDNKGNYRQAIKDYTKAIELNPKDAVAYENRGIDYERIGDNTKAKADRKKYEELTGKN